MFSEAGELGRGYTTRALEEVVARSWEEPRFEKTTLAVVWRLDN